MPKLFTGPCWRPKYIHWSMKEAKIHWPMLEAKVYSLIHTYHRQMLFTQSDANDTGGRLSLTTSFPLMPVGGCCSLICIRRQHCSLMWSNADTAEYSWLVRCQHHMNHIFWGGHNNFCVQLNKFEKISPDNDRCICKLSPVLLKWPNATSLSALRTVNQVSWTFWQEEWGGGEALLLQASNCSNHSRAWYHCLGFPSTNSKALPQSFWQLKMTKWHT